MAAGKIKKLKVFQAPFGFYDSVIAAPSQAAALRAWGSHQNLFAEGVAHVVTDEQIVTAALAHPEIPLRRAVGSTGRFALDPLAPPALPEFPKTAPRPERKAKIVKAQPPDRSALDVAEKAIRELEETRKIEEADYARKRQQQRNDEARAQRAYSEAKRAASAALEKARKAYAKAGGSN